MKLEAKGKGTKVNQAMRLCMKNTRGMPLAVRPVLGEKKRKKIKQNGPRNNSIDFFPVQSLCGQRAAVYNGYVKVLLIQRSSNQVLFRKRSSNQILLTKWWRGCAPLVYTTK